jgi:hypothetical protein
LRVSRRFALLGEQRSELGQTIAGLRADPQRSRIERKVAVGNVAFIEDDDLPRGVEFEFVQQRIHRRALTRPVGVGGIDHVDERVGFAQFFERGAKGVD